MRSNRRTAIAAVLVALGGGWLWAPPGQAMNTKPMNLSDLVRESNQIVVGSIAAVNQGLGANQLPYTEVEVKVSESILGNLAPPGNPGSKKSTDVSFPDGLANHLAHGDTIGLCGNGQ